METLKLFNGEATPEFQKLSVEQQAKRWHALSQTLGTILEDSTSLELTQPQIAVSFADALELHFTGKIERLPYKEKASKKRRK